jgi:arginyl-tRNA synthetase
MSHIVGALFLRYFKGVQAKIRKILEEAVGAKIGFDVFVPERKSFGHYSTNVALRLAKSKPPVPLKLAQELIPKIQKHAPAGFFEKIEAAPPGFINFWLSSRPLCAELRKILKEKSEYGSSKIGKGKKIQVEFVSANPTGPLTLANGRGGFLGDVISNVLEKSGYKVEREYYVNDTGNQILTFGKSILAIAGQIPWEENFYKGEYLKDWAKNHRALIKKHITNPLLLGRTAAKDFLKDIKIVLGRKAGIKFDRWTSEQKNIRQKRLEKEALAIIERKSWRTKKTGQYGLKPPHLATTRIGF